MSTPKLRMVAGPNGSGKSTLLDHLRTLNFRIGHWLNPDELERRLQDPHGVAFKAWDIRADQATLRRFVSGHPLASRGWATAIRVKANVLRIDRRLRRSTGYLAAVLSGFLRSQWLASRQSFTFETVMSSPDKVELLRKARADGYRTYLYYVCTDSPLINRERIAARVAQGGHGVPANKVGPRYRRSLGLLPAAIELSDRAFLFDNSGKEHRLVAEFDAGRLVRVSDRPPEWFVASWINKQARP